MPLAMSLEVLAEGAAALVGAGVVTGLRDVRAHRWIAFPGPLELEVAARRLAGARRRRARARRAARPARAARPRVEGTVIVRAGYDAAPAPLAPPADGVRASERPPGALYGEVMFHGPTWQGGRGHRRRRAGAPPSRACGSCRPTPASSWTRSCSTRPGR